MCVCPEFLRALYSKLSNLTRLSMLEKRKEEDDEEEKGEEKRKKNDNRKQEEAKTLSIMDSQCRVQLNGLSQKRR